MIQMNEYLIRNIEFWISIDNCADDINILMSQLVIKSQRFLLWFYEFYDSN